MALTDSLCEVVVALCLADRNKNKSEKKNNTKHNILLLINTESERQEDREKNAWSEFLCKHTMDFIVSLCSCFVFFFLDYLTN